MNSPDVVVVGAGPAGWAVADRCARLGLDTLVVAPDPVATWRPTYGVWADQCAFLPSGSDVVAATAVWAEGRRLARGYRVLDNASVLAAFRRGPARAVSGHVRDVAEEPDGTLTVALADGAPVRCRVVVDASGQRRLLSGGPPAGARVEQTAYGVVVPSAVAAPLVAPGEAVFMRWDHRPTFLYAVPLPGDRTLLEETSLARRPGLPLPELRARLTHRLAAAGIPAGELAAEGVPAGETEVERVRFAVDTPLPRRRRGVVAFGAAAAMIHPATGYSVGDALAMAPSVAAAIADELPRGGPAAARAAEHVVWSGPARVVRRLRLAGLRSLLALPPARVPEFFAAFFDLEPALQQAYLSGRADVPGTAAAMTSLFLHAPTGLRGAMAFGWLPRIRH
jgi:lycopene beta-cyclase